MTPDEIRQFNELVTRFDIASKKLDDFLNVYYRFHLIDKDIWTKMQEFRDKVYFTGEVNINSTFYLKDGGTVNLGASTGGKIGATEDKIGFFGKSPVAQQATITAPTGGGTIDSQARSSIGEIKTVLTNLGLTA